MTNALCGVFIFQMHISEHEPPAPNHLKSPHLKKHKETLCFLFVCKEYVVMLPVRHVPVLDCLSCGVCVCVHSTGFALTPYCVLVPVSFLFFSFFCMRFQICCSPANYLLRYYYTRGVQVSPCGWPWINFGVSFCFVFFRGGSQPPAGRTSPQRTVWWWRCRPVRPAPGLCQLSWPAICWWPTYCSSTFSSLSSSTYIGMSCNAAATSYIPVMRSWMTEKVFLRLNQSEVSNSLFIPQWGNYDREQQH